MTVRRKIKAAGTTTKRKGRPAIRRKPDAGIAFLTGRAAAIDRIVKAVGKPPDDKEKLALDIDSAEIQLRIVGLYEGAKATERHALVRRIRKGIEKYVALINADRLICDDLQDMAGGPPMGGAPPAEGLLAALRRLEDSTGRTATALHSKDNLPPSLKRPPPKERRRPTGGEWLLGVTLPLVYEKRFGSRITFNRDIDGKPIGPLIDFIQSTTEALGLAYKRETIAKAITRLREIRDSCRE